MTNVICFEGLDRSGKTTTIKQLQTILEKENKKVVYIPSLADSTMDAAGRILLNEDRSPFLKEFRRNALIGYFSSLSYYKLAMILDYVDREYDYVLVDRTHISGYIYNDIHYEHLLHYIRDKTNIRSTLVYMDVTPDKSIERVAEEKNITIEELGEESNNIVGYYYKYDNYINGLRNVLKQGMKDMDGFNVLIETPVNPTLDYIKEILPKEILTIVNSNKKYYCSVEKN